MRIMMLPQFYPPIIGGEERFAHDLSMSMARRGHDVSVVTLWQPGNADLTGLGDPERVQLALVDQRFFHVVDVVPLMGRTLVAADHEPGAADVVVISHTLWQRRFGGAGDVVGRQVTLGGEPREIVGVLPAKRIWPAEP